MRVQFIIYIIDKYLLLLLVYTNLMFIYKVENGLTYCLFLLDYFYTYLYSKL